MNPPYVLALDVGTSSVRAILFDSRARTVSHVGGEMIDAQVKYTQRTTADGGVEVDADALFDATVTCLAKVVRKTSRAKLAVSGVGISCFWHSLMGVGSNGRAVTPLYSWADTRSSICVPQLRGMFAADEYHQTTGAELHPCFWAAKLLWLRADQPKRYQSATRWMGFAEYLMLRLFGDGGASLSMASGTGLFNQARATWDDAILNAIGIDEASLPVIAGNGGVAGLRDEYRERLTGLADIPWFPAAGDGAVSNIGSGGTDDRRLVLNIGTSAAIRVVIPAPKGAKVAIRQGLFCYRVDDNHVIQGGAFANGGNVFAWLKGLMQWGDDAEFTKQVARVRPDGHGITVMPFWAGERSPGWRPDARAAILGMNLHTDRADIVRASLEGCAYSFDVIRKKLNEQFPQATETVLSGGAIASSPLLCQIICDVFGVPLVTSKVAEASSRGAALIALQGIGAMKSWSAAPFERGVTIKPNAARHQAYNAGASRFDAVYEMLIARG